MKKVIFIIILTLFTTCGSVYSNPAIDALEDELEYLRSELPNLPIEGLIRMNKLREILQSMKRQERDNEVLREWEKEQRDRPCEHLDQKALKNSECEKVKI